MVAASDFSEFFRLVNDRSAARGGDEPMSPFRWQVRLVEDILAHGGWPDRIAAPTGSGKSCVIDVHLFVNAVAAQDKSIRLPRRLVAAVDRRALVDDQFARGGRIADQLSAVAGPGLLSDIRDALRSLRGWEPPADPRRPDPGFDLTSLRGGVPPDPVWRDDPTACGVVCATPDMWGSRVLFRGYVSSRNARPRDAGLLAMDCVLVLDEAHLNRQLLATARRIAELENLATERLRVPYLQVVETTATPAGDHETGREVSVADTDWRSGGSDHDLGRRLTTPKPVELVESANWPGTTAGTRKALATEIAERAIALREERKGTVGVVVNTVALAIEVHECLGSSVSRLIAGRMRPHDLSQLRRDHPDLFKVRGDPSIDILVATQTVEVGMDLDLTALVTELAPGSAIAQRAGRVNRLGRRDDARVEVLVPADPKKIENVKGPYRQDDLVDGWEWLRGRAEDPAGLAPWSVIRDPAPTPRPRRTLFQRLELADTWILADTSRPMFAEPDLDLWLSDDLDADDDMVSLVVRERLPEDDNQALELLRVTTPTNYECFPARIGTARKILSTILGDPKNRSRAFRFRSGVVEALSDPSDIRPGDILVVDAAHKVCRAQVVDEDPREHATDVYESTLDGAPPSVIRIVSGTGEGDPRRMILLAVSDIVRESSTDTLGRRRSIAEAIDEVSAGLASLIDATGTAEGSLDHAATMLRQAKHATEVYLGQPDDDGQVPWMVVRSNSRRLDEELRQTWNRGDPVTLIDHASDVERRAASLATKLGLPAQLQSALALAGRHHDDGKSDPRFQRVLQRSDQPDLAGEKLLAKSGAGSSARRGGTSAAQSRAAQVRLEPTGWRHEQLSVVRAWSAVAADDERELILRLVGTSHGRGRGGFPHSARQLLPAQVDGEALAIAESVFDVGLWDELMSNTMTRFGAWGCAYLEGVLRAADCQVSEEGGR